MVRVIDGRRYNTGTATKLASDCYWDGHNFERNGTNSYLFRGKNGNYFIQYLTQWQGDQDHLVAISQEEAREYYESMREQYVDYEVAFPGVKVEDA